MPTSSQWHTPNYWAYPGAKWSKIPCVALSSLNMVGPDPRPFPRKNSKAPTFLRFEVRDRDRDLKRSLSLSQLRSLDSMGFFSFAGRVLFASVFLLSAYQEFIEFGADGGPAAKTLKPKFNLFTKNLALQLSIEVPHIEMRHVIATTIALKGLGGLLFIFSSSLGAYLLLLYLMVITPITYDFYNYDIEKSEFVQLFIKFTQNLALFGALLFYLGMKNSIPKRQPKKKGQKSKSA